MPEVRAPESRATPLAEVRSAVAGAAGGSRRLLLLWGGGVVATLLLAGWTALLFMAAGTTERARADAAQTWMAEVWRPGPSALFAARQAEVDASPRVAPSASEGASLRAIATPEGRRRAEHRSAVRSQRADALRAFYFNTLGPADSGDVRDIPLAPLEGAPDAPPIVYRRRLD